MRNRPLRVVVCFTHDEYAQYQKQLAASGLTKQAHGLKALLGKEIKPRKCDHHPALLKTLSGISNDINAILHVLKSNGHLTEGETSNLQERIDACWQVMRSY